MNTHNNKKELKRKATDNSNTLSNNAAKRKFANHAQRIGGNKTNALSQIDIFKDMPRKFVNSAQNRLQSNGGRTANKLDTKSFSRDPSSNCNREQVSKDSPFKHGAGCSHLPSAATNTSMKSNEMYSANKRLKGLRQKLSKSSQRAWFPSDLAYSPQREISPLRTSVGNSYNSNVHVKEKGVKVWNDQKTIQQFRSCSSNYKPVFPMPSIESKTASNNNTSTFATNQGDIYYDSDSASEFGNMESFPVFKCNFGQCTNQVSHLQCIRQHESQEYNVPVPCKPNDNVDIYQKAVNKTYFNNDLHYSNSPINCPKIVHKEQYSANKTTSRLNDERLSRKPQTSQQRYTPYSANDRLQNIQTNNSLSGNKKYLDRQKTQEKPSENIGSSKFVNNLQSCSLPSNDANSSFKQTERLIFNSLDYNDNLQEDSQITRGLSLASATKLPSQDRLCNISNSISENTTKQLGRTPLSGNVVSDPNQFFNSLLLTKETGAIDVNSMFRNAVNYEETMDWSDIDETETLLNLQSLRKTFKESDLQTHVPLTPFQEVVANTSPEMCHNMTILRDIFVVVDTNIFISHLRVIKQVLEVKINGVETPIVMIPWIVIQELDYIKDGRSGNKLKRKAQDAIHFINRKLSSKDSFVKGQSVMDAAQQDFSSKNLDDGVLHCCLQIIKKRNKATLFTNDVNLRNKALLHDVPAYGHDKIITALDPYHNKDETTTSKVASPEDDRITELKTHLGYTCSYIIIKLLEQDYGPIWEKLKTTNPPWSLQECVGLFHRYWVPVFSMHLNKQFAKLIDNFGAYLKTKHEGIIPIEEGETLMEFSLALCVFLKNGLPNFKNTINSCISNIQNIVL